MEATTKAKAKVPRRARAVDLPGMGRVGMDLDNGNKSTTDHPKKL